MPTTGSGGDAGRVAPFATARPALPTGRAGTLACDSPRTSPVARLIPLQLRGPVEHNGQRHRVGLLRICIDLEFLAVSGDIIHKDIEI